MKHPAGLAPACDTAMPMREIRRHTRVIGAFPDGDSALNLAAARMRHFASSKWSTNRYFKDEAAKSKDDDRLTRSTTSSEQKVRKILGTIGGAASPRDSCWVGATKWPETPSGRPGRNV